MHFISCRKLFLFLRYLNFCCDLLLVMQKHDFVKTKLMTSQTGQQVIAIHILPNISRSKGSQRMEFGQLIEYQMRNIFLEKSYTKCDRETSPESL